MKLKKIVKALEALNKLLARTESRLNHWVPLRQLKDGAESAPKFTPRVKVVISIAARVAREQKNDYVTTEHVLAGLYLEGNGAAAKALRKWGIEEDVLREELFPKAEHERS